MPATFGICWNASPATTWTMSVRPARLMLSASSLARTGSYSIVPACRRSRAGPCPSRSRCSRSRRRSPARAWRPFDATSSRRNRPSSSDTASCPVSVRLDSVRIFCSSGDCAATGVTASALRPPPPRIAVISTTSIRTRQPHCTSRRSDLHDLHQPSRRTIDSVHWRRPDAVRLHGLHATPRHELAAAAAARPSATQSGMPTARKPLPATNSPAWCASRASSRATPREVADVVLRAGVAPAVDARQQRRARKSRGPRASSPRDDRDQLVVRRSTDVGIVRAADERPQQHRPVGRAPGPLRRHPRARR